MKYPLIELPAEVQSTLYLIKEELKSRKLFRALTDVGLDGSYFQPHLDSLILRSLDMDEDSDEVFDAYYEIMERRSKEINRDDDSITKQAFKVYQELKDEKKKLDDKKKMSHGRS